ncbi:MAG: glycosyltransferase family 2 protein [Candidatus Altiarchaeota archaeon]
MGEAVSEVLNGEKEKLDLSIIIPVYNEQDNILPLAEEINNVLASRRFTFEILFVDDGSTDDTFEEIVKIRERIPQVKALRFRRNFGQTSALNAGFKHVLGEIVVVLDGDLQNDPSDIPRLLEKLKEGNFDVVSGWRHPRKDPFFSKRLPSEFANWLARMLTGVKLHDFGCSLKAYRGECLANLELYGEMHRYIPAIIAVDGYKIGELVVNHRPRKFGKTKYGVTRMIRGLLDLMYVKFWQDYSTQPLHFFGILGFIQIFAAFIIGLYKVVWQRIILLESLNLGPLLLLFILLTMNGALFIVLGFLGEIMVRNYYAESGRKNYSIKEVLE